ncbi:MAG: hypothetical protein K8R90_10930 [Candidatus Cloacimonetes bacterium]|nr:hypothetical protein [Candidatus Cloacimonadota bacterium]
MKPHAVKKQVVLCQVITFILFIGLLWAIEVFDWANLLFGAPATPINVVESIVETVVCIIVGAVCIGITVRLQRRLSHLEEFLIICSNCKRVNVNDRWILIEEFMHSHTDTELSHGLCDECVKKLYPGLADKVLKSRKA